MCVSVGTYSLVVSLVAEEFKSIFRFSTHIPGIIFTWYIIIRYDSLLGSDGSWHDLLGTSEKALAH